MEKHHFQWVKITISMAIFNSKLLNYQRVQCSNPLSSTYSIPIIWYNLYQRGQWSTIWHMIVLSHFVSCYIASTIMGYCSIASCWFCYCHWSSIIEYPCIPLLLWLSNTSLIVIIACAIFIPANFYGWKHWYPAVHIQIVAPHRCSCPHGDGLIGGMTHAQMDSNTSSRPSRLLI